MVASDEPATHLNGLRLAVWLDVPLWGSWAGLGPDLPWDDRMSSFWQARSAENASAYVRDIISAAADDLGMRYVALERELITPEEALEMRGGLLSLLQGQDMEIFGLRYGAYLIRRFHTFANDQDYPDAISAFTAVGHYLVNHPRPPWIDGSAYDRSHFKWARLACANARPSLPGPLVYLGAAATLLLSAESDPTPPAHPLEGDPSRLGPFHELYAYMERRLKPGPGRPLPDLPVPDAFKQTFGDWAEGQVNFTTLDREAEQAGDG